MALSFRRSVCRSVSHDVLRERGVSPLRSYRSSFSLIYLPEIYKYNYRVKTFIFFTGIRKQLASKIMNKHSVPIWLFISSVSENYNFFLFRFFLVLSGHFLCRSLISGHFLSPGLRIRSDIDRIRIRIQPLRTNRIRPLRTLVKMTQEQFEITILFFRKK